MIISLILRTVSLANLRIDTIRRKLLLDSLGARLLFMHFSCKCVRIIFLKIKAFCLISRSFVGILFNITIFCDALENEITHNHVGTNSCTQ